MGLVKVLNEGHSVSITLFIIVFSTFSYHFTKVIRWFYDNIDICVCFLFILLLLFSIKTKAVISRKHFQNGLEIFYRHTHLHVKFHSNLSIQLAPDIYAQTYIQTEHFPTKPWIWGSKSVFKRICSDKKNTFLMHMWKYWNSINSV